MKQNILFDMILSMLILLFVYAGISKLISHQDFLFQLRISPNTRKYGAWLAWFVPMVELGIAVLLLFKRTNFVGLNCSIVLFGIYIYANLCFKYYVPAISGGILTRVSYKPHLILNTILLALSIAGVVLEIKREALKRRRKDYQLLNNYDINKNIAGQQAGEAENLYKRVGKPFNF